jgi:predicted kinase
MKACIVLMSGSPLSGKSTIAKQIKSHFGGNCYIASTDEIRKEITGTYEDHSREADVWATVIKRMLKHLGKGKVVVLDATLRQKQLRLDHLEYYKRFPIYYIAFERLPVEVILERNLQRNWKQIDESRLREMWAEYEVPDEEEMKLYAGATMINNDNAAEKVGAIISQISAMRAEGGGSTDEGKTTETP